MIKNEPKWSRNQLKNKLAVTSVELYLTDHVISKWQPPLEDPLRVKQKILILN